MTDELRELLEAVQAGNFSDLSAEQIAEARAAVRETVGAYANGDLDLTAEEARSLVTAGVALRDYATALDTAEEATDTEEATAEVDAPTAEELAALVSDLEDTEPEAAEEAVEAVVASAPSVADIAARRPVRAASQPTEEAGTPAVLVAASGAPRTAVPEDAPILASAEALGAAFMDARNTVGTPAQGSAKYRFAHRRWDDASHTLQPGASVEDTFSVLAQVRAQAQREARAAIDAGPDMAPIRAASGICGPADTDYDPYTIGSPTAGLWSLPSVNLARGSINVFTPLTYEDLRETAGIAFKYTSTMGGGSPNVTKDVYSVSCGDTVNFELAGYSTIQRFSNFQAMFNPEWVAHVSRQSLMTHAHRVNRDLIDIYEADARVVDHDTSDKGGGALVQFARQVLHAAFNYRDKFRLEQTEVLDFVFPYITLGALLADGIARQDALANAGQVASVIDTIQREANVRVQWVYDFIDSAEAPGDFGDQAYRALFYPAGSVVRITAQTLDLGEVRDSTRNAENEFDLFVETFDGIAVNASEVGRITNLNLAPSGEVGNAVSITTTSGASVS